MNILKAIVKSRDIVYSKDLRLL